MKKHRVRIACTTVDGMGSRSSCKRMGSIKELREYFSPEQIQAAIDHKANFQKKSNEGEQILSGDKNCLLVQTRQHYHSGERGYFSFQLRDYDEDPIVRSNNETLLFLL